MKIEVNPEDLLKEVGVVTEVDRDKRTGKKGRPRYGVQLTLKSARGTDSTITFWVPWSLKTGYDHEQLIDLFGAMMDSLEEFFSHGDPPTY